MSSRKTQKWSSYSSLSKLISRISRTLSFSSKKCQQASKRNNQTVKPMDPPIRSVSFAPKSAPVPRRVQPQPVMQSVYYGPPVQLRPHHHQVHRPPYLDSHLEEDDDDDYSRYSLKPNLSLFHISVDNIPSQLNDDEYDTLRQHDWRDDIFHSTKIDEY